MFRILFICHGNICRSPMAEMILRHMVQKKGWEGDFLIASCATSREEIAGGVGNPVYPPARRELEKHGIACADRAAVQLRHEDYEKYDRLICMDHANLRDAQRLLGGDPAGKLCLLMDHTARGGDVADPWYSDRFDRAFCDIYAGCEGLLKCLKRGAD